MELMYPIVIVVCLILALLIYFVNFNKKNKYTLGKKVANTKYIKETDYYKAKVRQYKILSNIIKILSIICIVTASILIARPVKVQNASEDKYNRDIILGLDTSTSEANVNLELVKKFKTIIPSIEGDRIGIVIYNTAPIVYCPLTDDYDFIQQSLDKMQKQFDLLVKNDGDVPREFSSEEEEAETQSFWYGGTIANAEERGSSLVGDGLAGTLFSFPNIKNEKDRTRIIIFATDNDVSGKETVSLSEASALCKQYNVKLYAYCPTVEMNEYTSTQKIASYKKAVEESAGGKFYTGDLDKMTSNIVKEIKETKTSLLKTSKKTYVKDYPEIFLICTIIIFVILIIVEKRIRL